ncbi:rhomboid family intramembrane serine protease [Sulfitobacter sp. SK012]|uniref:rhomboid family intramembrane serine protease n=1 Tax=Sulfitobacter sp. SK012 TaxID=1389005 RepID=UPI000E0B3C9D|nr:rhomboid family intramembrane serine protease [Sulfitobacter sp. SK012]AXI46937.1 rhomboid family intramembrane serine protease [Sulfitobacter sp. SK012]AXI47913.1 rhomboid family intramembrane serine protease [Sulfitobacter sp. SK012]
MATDKRDQFHRHPKKVEPGAPGFLWVLIGVMAVIELPLTLSDAGWIGSNSWRINVFLYGAFWQLLLDGGLAPLYASQKVLMFLTHAFLHGSIAHFVMNSVVLLALGKGVAAYLGVGKTILLLALSAITGAAAFGLLSAASGPMIGASGAVFGLLGLWQAWDFRQRRQLNQSVRPVLSGIMGLLLVNLVLFVVLSGTLAWEAHLGGWIVGWTAAWTFASQRKTRSQSL